MSAISQSARLLGSIFNPFTQVRAVRDGFTLIRSQRRLITEMAKRELANRHAGQALGVLWAAAHPLFQMGLMVFIFGFVFQQRIGGTFDLPRDYTVYILCGLAAWLSISPALVTSANSVVGNAALLKQFQFDARVLPVKDIAINSVVWVLSIATVMVYTLVKYGGWPLTYLLIPLVALLHFTTVIGCAWVLSSLVVFFRDLRELVVLGVTAMVYLLPIVYLPAWVPNVFRPIIYLNPFSYLIWVYQDVFYFGRIEHPLAWPAAAVFSLLCFSIGYRLFKRMEPMFGRML